MPLLCLANIVVLEFLPVSNPQAMKYQSTLKRMGLTRERDSNWNTSHRVSYFYKNVYHKILPSYESFEMAKFFTTSNEVSGIGNGFFLFPAKMEFSHIWLHSKDYTLLKENECGTICPFSL